VGNKPSEAEDQLALEIRLLQMLEAQVTDDTWGPSYRPIDPGNAA